MSDAVVTRMEGDVLVVTLNRPDARNAINLEVIRGLSEAWDLAASPEVGAIVLTGAGTAFCSGVDIRNPPSMEGLRGSRLRNWMNPMVLELAALPKAVVVAVNGQAVGAGLALATAGDVRIASDSATFTPVFIERGLVPDTGASHFIPRLIGTGRATHWLLSNSTLDAPRAQEWGLVSEVVSGSPVDRAVEVASALAAQPATALALTKELLRNPAADLAGQIEQESNLQTRALAARQGR